MLQMALLVDRGPALQSAPGSGCSFRRCSRWSCSCAEARKILETRQFVAELCAAACVAATVCLIPIGTARRVGEDSMHRRLDFEPGRILPLVVLQLNRFFGITEIRLVLWFWASCSS